MIVRWSPEAAADFAAIVGYIRKENPSASERVAHEIYGNISSLTSFPHRGRPGKIKDTRERVDSPSIHRGISGEIGGRRNCARAARLTTLAIVPDICAIESRENAQPVPSVLRFSLIGPHLFWRAE